jgi:hypothetical protein
MTRPAGGEATRFVAGAAQSAPAWLKLTRTGSVVTAFVSGDGSNWNTVGSTLLSFDPTQPVVGGLAVTSHDPNVLNTAIFDSVSVATAATPLPSPGQNGDIVIRANDIVASALHGAWRKTTDPWSPDGITLFTPDAGVSQQRALASPADYVDVAFSAPANTPYRLWLRLRASANSKLNDSVWVQYSDAFADGSPLFKTSTSSGLLVNLATDAGAASLSGWGWHNGAYWLSQPTTVTFGGGGVHTLRIQTREDGAEIDQIVLSPATYFDTSPGPVSNDLTIVGR